jgi:site-specific DNA recombinase
VENGSGARPAPIQAMRKDATTERCRWASKRLVQEHQQNLSVGRSSENHEILKSQLARLQHGLETLIDSYSEGAIEKEQFLPRRNRAKGRIAEFEARIYAYTKGFDHLQESPLLVDHFQEIAVHFGPELEDADWSRRREIIRSIVERMEIGHARIAVEFRVSHGIAPSTEDLIVVTWSRC